MRQVMTRLGAWGCRVLRREAQIFHYPALGASHTGAMLALTQPGGMTGGVTDSVLNVTGGCHRRATSLSRQGRGSSYLKEGYLS